MYAFLHKFCTFPVTEGNEIDTFIPVQDPSKKAHPQHKIQTFPHTERCKFWKYHNYLRLWTRESSKSNQERQEFREMHSLTFAKMPTNKESIFPEFCTFRTMIQMHSITLSNTNQLIILGNT